MHRSLDEIIIDYMRTKSIAWEFVDHIKQYGTPNELRLYRGDCLYESTLQVGNRFRLWNTVASFTSDFSIADKFANGYNVPTWYIDETEWDKPGYNYPFSKNIENNENLIPVIITIEKSSPIKAFYTDFYLDEFDESEYVLFVDDIEFEIVSIKDKIVKCKVHELTNEYKAMNIF